MNWNSGRLWLKITVYSLLASCALLLGLFALFATRFDSEAIRAELEQSLAQQNYRAQVRGSITPRLFPLPGVRVTDLDLRETDGRPLAHVDTLDVGLSWWPLITGHNEIRALTLDGVTLDLRRNEDGSFNFSDLLRRRRADNVTVRLDDLSLRRFDLRFEDSRNKRHWRLDEVSLDLDDMRGASRLAFGGRLTQGSRVLSLALNTPYTQQDDAISIHQLDAVLITQSHAVGEGKLRVQGQFKLNLASLQATGQDLLLTFTTSLPKAEVQARLPQLTATLGQISAPSMTLNGHVNYGKAGYSLKGQVEELRVDNGGAYADSVVSQFVWAYQKHALTVNLEAPLMLSQFDSLRMEPLTLNARLSTPALPRGQLAARLQGALDGELSQSLLNLRVGGLLDGANLAATVRQQGFASPSFESTLTVGQLDLNRYLPEAKPEQAVALLQDATPLRLDWMDLLNLKAKVSIGELAMGRFKVDGVTGDVEANHQRLALDNLSMNIYQGELGGSIRLERSNGAAPRLEIRQTLNNMNIRPLLVDLLDVNRIEGVGRAQLALSSQGNSFQEWRNRLSGEVQASLSHGALTGIDLVAALKNLPAELKDWNNNPLAADRNQKTAFSALSASFTLNNGVARNQDLKLASELVNVAGSGKFDLTQSIVDYALNVKANPSSFQNLKGVSVPLKITGQINAPTYALDFNAIVKGKKTDGEKQQALKQQLSKQITTILP